MHPALQGLLVGLGVGVLLLIFEYVMISKAVNERAQKYHQKPEFDVTDRRRMHSMMRFAFVLPFGFAVIFWMISFAQ